MHPVTLGTLCLLLVNDQMFKAAWPGAWLPGKLSDFAWMVFAPPVLAYCLSFTPLRSERGQQAALVAAYVGLPTLYAAFNTFAPVHDGILWTLGLAGGLLGWDGARSPLDPTDSLVIPLAMAVAAWVWRRPPIPGDALRARVAVLVVSIAALASVATSYGYGYEGVRAVGRTPEGTIGAIASPPPHSSYDSDVGRSYYGIYESHDGGWTWTERTLPGRPEPDWLMEERVRVIDNAHFTSDALRVYRSLLDQGTIEVVYSYDYLGNAGNRWAQATDYAYLGEQRITTEAYDIFVDNNSGNVIVAMGLQGVVVIPPDGTATPVRVGEFGPTDFSFLGKARILAGSYAAIPSLFQLVALLLLALSSSAFALVGPSAQVDVRSMLFGAVLVAFLAAVAIGVYPTPNQYPGQFELAAGGWYAGFATLGILVSGFGLVPLLLIVIGFAQSRVKAKKLALVLMVTIALMVFPIALGAPYLFASGSRWANLVPVGLTLAVALCIWLYQKRRSAPSTHTL